MSRFTPLVLAATLLALGGCSPPPAEKTTEARIAETRAIEAEAHGAYVDAINSNDVEKLMTVLSDDIVYQAPGAPEIIGKDAVREWAADYFAAYRTRWEKTPLHFTVNGDWAFERYTYKATDTDRQSGAVTTDSGKGINIFHRQADGKWRVAVDGWSSDKPAAPTADQA